MIVINTKYGQVFTINYQSKFDLYVQAGEPGDLTPSPDWDECLGVFVNMWGRLIETA